MITPELISYIKRQLENNLSKDLIVSRLVGAGWRMEDVHEGFLNVDSYHEPVGGDSIFEIKKVEPIKIEIPEIEIKNEDIVKEEKPKIWTPISIPVREVKIYKEANNEIKNNETKIEIQNIEIAGKKEEVKNPPISPVSRISVDHIQNDNVRPLNTNNIDIPQKPKNEGIKNLSQIAMLSSYQSDVSLLTKKKDLVVKKKGKKSFGWLVILIIILILGASFWAYKNGYINISNFKNVIAPISKKDPKVLILKNSEVLASLNSYKTETNIEISSPTFANLLSGKIVDKYLSSPEKDSFSINTLGIINKSGGESLSDNFVTVKSSLFPDYINIDVKSNGSDLFVSVPDLSKATGKFAPEPAIVKINKDQAGLISSLFYNKEEERLNRINLYKVISSGISSYINNENLSSYNDLINNVDVSEKGVESIKGIDTYHYSVSLDSQFSKNILTKVSGDFVASLSTIDSEKLKKMVSETTLKSFDVWIGKEDNNIYQYSVALDIPLSDILEIGDKNITDSKVDVIWKTTYYDFNIQNNLFMPSQFIAATDFVNNSKKVQLKNGVSDFKELADSLFNKEKSYGVKSNTSGSCMSPIAGSLFSSVGHNIDAVKEVGDVSDLLKEILERTSGTGFCYSTTKDWSFTVPIVDNYDVNAFPEGGYKTFFCTDSTGAKENLTSLPKGSICLPKASVKTQTKP